MNHCVERILVKNNTISDILFSNYLKSYLNQITYMCKKGRIHNSDYETYIRISSGFCKHEKIKFRIDYFIFCSFTIYLYFCFRALALTCVHEVCLVVHQVLLTCSTLWVMYMHVTSRVYRVKIVYSNSC